ncbi:hypothetical protein ZOSMA_83G00030 [Zostera marina]|uniref:HSF-type DNA-binding domain-containing protein n=1 Tax=Zostera marina TaxID=29655 RepID=A0A0K9NLM0_ZOSMR|nr:hypothetical protein ZOSMA_83G00030 [Zostera marina]
MDGEEEVKEECTVVVGDYSNHLIMTPVAMECLHDTMPPPFLMKTYDMVEDISTNDVVSWSNGRNSFIVWNSHTFASTLLPRYFKHDNFSSFIRQLNTYVSSSSKYRVSSNLHVVKSTMAIAGV